MNESSVVLTKIISKGFGMALGTLNVTAVVASTTSLWKPHIIRTMTAVIMT